MFKIGIIGAGAIGMPHKVAVEGHPECELTAICDLVEEKAKELATGTEARIYTDYKVMAEKEELDAVILNLPHFLHKEATVYFLEKNISVLVEKPMAIDVAECEAMGNAEKASKAVLAIGHVQRYYDWCKELKKIVDDERFGKLCLITEVRNADYFSNRPEWFLEKKKAGGGIVMNYCAHTLDKVFYITGQDIKSVHSNINNQLNDRDIEAQAQVLIELENGVSAMFNYCSSRINYMYETLFYFTDGVCRVSGGLHLETSVKGQEFTRVDLDYEHETITEQFEEFVKLMKGEEANIARVEYSTKVIDTIRKILD